MTATASRHEQRAAEFTAAVRERLSDLPAEELDDLLDGLQADVAERLEEGGELGDPEAYAEELRQAAGLPERTSQAGERRSLRLRLEDASKGFGARASAYWAATPARRAIRDFVVSLRPAWWILRGVAVSWALLIFSRLADWGQSYESRINVVTVTVTLGVVVLSVQWGRGRWAPSAWLRWLRGAVSVVAVILLIPLMIWTVDLLATPKVEDLVAEAMEPGLRHDGQEVMNIFAYDCSGQPLDGVQLYDQDGGSLTTLNGGDSGYRWDEARQRDLHYQLNGLAITPEAWNVFPLWAVVTDAEGGSGAAEPEQPPFDQVRPLSDTCPAAGAEDAGDSGTGDADAGDAGAGANRDPTPGSETPEADTAAAARRESAEQAVGGAEPVGEGAGSSRTSEEDPAAEGQP